MMEDVTQETKPLIIVREFDAPREAVWRAWTDPALFARWWGPEHFTGHVAHMDVQPGSHYHWAMLDPEGNKYWSTGTFHEVVAPERLVFSDSFADADGNVIPAAAYGMGDDFPDETLVTVTLEALPGSRTRLTLVNAGVPEGQMREMSSAGWLQSFDKLAATL